MKILFIDIDGTLITFENGEQIIPKSAMTAIKEIRKQGYLVYYCTGRSKAEIETIPPLEVDGVIGAAGGYIESNHQIIYHQTLESEQLKRIRDYLERHDIIYYLESNDGLYCNEKSYQHLIQTWFNGDIAHPMSRIVHQIEGSFHPAINKISFHSYTLSYEEIEATFKKDFTVVRSSYSDDHADGEISLKNINKSTAIQYLLNYLNYPEVNTYGFGDSMNDREMFECVDFAIAMGNAKEDIKQLADFVTKDVKDDGLYYAMKELKLIGQ